MGSAIENGAANVGAPIMGDVRVLALSTSASSTQNLGEFLAGPEPKNTSARWITFISSGRFYITFNSSSTITDPDSTSTSGNGRTWEVPADQPFSVRITAATRYFKARAAADTPNLRWYPSENKP